MALVREFPEGTGGPQDLESCFSHTLLSVLAGELQCAPQMGKPESRSQAASAKPVQEDELWEFSPAGLI